MHARKYKLVTAGNTWSAANYHYPGGMTALEAVSLHARLNAADHRSYQNEPRLFYRVVPV